MYLLVDNYDSFTYNLYALMKNQGAEVDVIRNTDPLPDMGKYRGIVLSPGPSRPENAGMTPEIVREQTGRIPIFGVCLGMQAIGAHLGNTIRSANTIQHGKTDIIRFKAGSVLFDGISGPFAAVRYHSLAVDAKPETTPVTATADSDGEVMAIEDVDKQLFGVQFHPESILSEQGDAIVRNFLKFCENDYAAQQPSEKLDLNRLAGNKPMSYRDARKAFNAMMRGDLQAAEVGAILTAMRVRGETADEISGAADALNHHKVRFDRGDRMAVDTCGTGGDGKNCMNVSTAVSLTLAAMDIPVVKHGNRAMSGAFGSADILEALDIPLSPDPVEAMRMFDQHGFTFLFAPNHHPAMRHVVPHRKVLGFPTIFNLVGPLANPADPPYQVIGLPSMERLFVMAEAAARLGRRRIILYSSEDGYDEVSTAAPTRCMDIQAEGVNEFAIHPAEFFSPRPMPEVRNAEEAELTFIRAIAGSDPDLTNLLAINAALALLCCGRADTMQNGFTMAKETLVSGQVSRYLKKLTAV